MEVSQKYGAVNIAQSTSSLVNCLIRHLCFAKYITILSASQKTRFKQKKNQTSELVIL